MNIQSNELCDVYCCRPRAILKREPFVVKCYVEKDVMLFNHNSFVFDITNIVLDVLFHV